MVDTQTVQSVAVGQKDQNKGLFHLWQETFQLPRVKRYINQWGRVQHPASKVEPHGLPVGLLVPDA